MQLSERHPIFIGFKLDGTLRRQLQSISGPDRRYISGEDSTFLRICRHGDDLYVGKVIEERLGTDRVDDVKRNVLSIVQRLCPENRLPSVLEIWVCSAEGEDLGDPLDRSGEPAREPDTSAERGW